MSSWTTQAIVSNIWDERPLSAPEIPKRHFLTCLVQDEPGVLSRVADILTARGFNIDSLVVCKTEIKDLSRMAIVLRGEDAIMEQARHQLESQIAVWAVLDYKGAPLMQRELLLARVNILGPEYFEGLLGQYENASAFREATVKTDSEVMAPKALEEESCQIIQTREKVPHSKHLAASEALRQKNRRLKDIADLTKQFGGKVLDTSERNCTLELSAKPTRIDSFIKLLSRFGILDSTRTGLLALPRSPFPETSRISGAEVRDIPDPGLLPPG